MKKIFLPFAFFLPLVALAAPLDSFKDLMEFLTELINAVVPILFTLALLTFFWGVAMYMKNADSAAKRAEGRTYMLYGVIGLFVMVSLWGLVSILANTFGVQIRVTPSENCPAGMLRNLESGDCYTPVL